MILHYALLSVLLFVFALLGTIAGHAVCHHGTRALQFRQAVAKSHVESHSEHAQCSHCKSVVARYEAFEDGTVVCANCVQEKRHSMRER